MLSQERWSLSFPSTPQATKKNEEEDSSIASPKGLKVTFSFGAETNKEEKTKQKQKKALLANTTEMSNSGSSKRTHLCTKCARSFSTMVELGEHSCVEAIPCPLCDHMAANRQMLNIHMPNCDGYRRNDLALKKEYLKLEASETINQDNGRIAQLIEQATNNRGELDRDALKGSIKDYMGTFFSDFCNKPEVEPLFARSAVKPIRAKLLAKAKARASSSEKETMGVVSDKMQIDPPEVLPAPAPVPAPVQAPSLNRTFIFKVPRKPAPIPPAAAAAAEATPDVNMNAPGRETETKKRKRQEEEEDEEKEASSGYFSESENDDDDDDANVKSPPKRQRTASTLEGSKKKAARNERLAALGDFMDLAPTLLKDQENVNRLQEEHKRYEAKLSRDRRALSELKLKPKETARFLDELRADIEELEAAGEVIDEEVENELGNDLVARNASAREKEQEIDATKSAVIKSQRDLNNSERLLKKRLQTEVQPLLVRSGIFDEGDNANHSSAIRSFLQSLLDKEKQRMPKNKNVSPSSSTAVSTSSKYVCTICCDEDNDSFQCNPACGHVFCSSCMLRSRGSCPKCRKPYTTTTTVFLE